MEEYYYMRSHVPPFGSWDWNDNLPFTQCFESATQAGFFRCTFSGHSSDQDHLDLYVAGDLYQNDVVTPAMIVVPRKRKTKQMRNYLLFIIYITPTSPSFTNQIQSSSVSLALPLTDQLETNLFNKDRKHYLGIGGIGKSEAGFQVDGAFGSGAATGIHGEGGRSLSDTSNSGAEHAEAGGGSSSTNRNNLNDEETVQ